MSAIFCLSGCGRQATPTKPGKPEVAEAKPDKHDDHDHDGALFADGSDKYHMRVDIDGDKNAVHLRVLDENDKEEVPLTAETMVLTIKNGKPHQVTLKAKRAEGKKESAHFEGSDARLTKVLDPAKIEISVDINKKNYIFTLDDHHGKKK